MTHSAKFRPVDSDILDLNNNEVVVAVADDGNVVVALIARADWPAPYSPPQAIHLLVLRPDAAHELGNKLRLAAKKSR